jgi:hypothetical protein
MENPNTPPRTPPNRGNKRARSESPSPRTPSPNRQEGTPQAPGAPKRPRRRHRLAQPNNFVATNLNFALTKAAQQQEEYDDFLLNQTGTEQQVPRSPSGSDDEDDKNDENESADFENEFGTF